MIKVWKCMDQQRSAIVRHIIKCVRCLPLSLTDVLGLDRHWSIIWSMTVCWMLDQRHPRVASAHQYLAKNFNRPAPVSLPKFCNLRTTVCNVMKSQVGCYNWSPATKLHDGCACTVCGPLYVKTWAGSPSLII